MPETTAASSTAAVVHGSFAIDTFDPTVSNWKRWLQRFEGAVTVFKIPREQKVAYLLHFIGPASFDLICDKFAPEDPYTKNYDAITEGLAAFYAPAPLEIAENFRFHQRKQMEGEPVQTFVAALQKLSIYCNFGAYLKTALRNQFVFGLSSKRIQSRLLETKDLTFEKAVDTATSMELSEKDTNQIQAGPATVAYVNTKKTTYKKNTAGKPPGAARSHKNSSAKGSPVKNKRNITDNINGYCYRCGEKHLASNCTMRRDIVCRNCGIQGHLQKVCMRKNQVPANQLNEILSIQRKHQAFRDSYYATLTIEGTPLRLEVDSGAAVTVVSERFLKQYFPNAHLEPSDLELFTYCKTIIPVVAYIVVHVQYKDKSKTLHMYISKENREPLVGREWIRQLDIQLEDEIYTLHTSTEKELQSILQEYTQKLDAQNAGIKSIQARLVIKENTRPVFLKARKVPFKLMPMVEQEIERLVKAGILEKTNTATWATPVVPVLKKDDTVRLCGDFSVTINKHLIIDEHPLPTIDELFYSLAGGEKFSKIDLTQAYLQMQVHPDDRELLTLNTHRGLYKVARLMYGIASAPAIWQREIENVLKDIPGVSVFLDDIKITGSTDEIHLQRLRQVLTRLGEFNIHINNNKCEFLKEGIHYCGYYIDKNGIHKEKAKITAIKNMPRPKDISELRAFLGLINYYGRFIGNLSTVLAPLHTLLEKRRGKEVSFIWTPKCEKAFLEAKKIFVSDQVLGFYDPKLPLIVASDASSYGVGAVLSQRQTDGTERVLQYASRSLTYTQKKYSQIDKEAYAIIFAIKKFTQYLYGNHFILLTDHRPLTQIFAPDKALPAHSALRMQHYAIFLRGFRYDIKYRNTKLHSNADALSRLPVADKDIYESDVVDRYEINLIESLPVTFLELRKETENDKELQTLVQGLLSNKTVETRDRFNIPQLEFSYQKGVILRDSRVVIPKQLRARILQELHMEHFGIVKMKSLARSFCWWSGIDRDLEKLARDCVICNAVQKEPAKITTEKWELPDTPFKRVHIDYAGPFMGHNFLVLVDAFSKWPEVYITRDMTSNTTIQKCRHIFTTFGIPEIIVSDNGRHFKSYEFAKFLQSNGITHKTTAPYHPATNGQAERFIQTMKSALKKNFRNSIVNSIQLHEILERFLFHYRTTPHSLTGVSPAEKMFNRKLRTRLSLVLPGTDEAEKLNHKDKLDNKNTLNNKNKLREFKIDDRVICRNYHGKEKWSYGKIKQRLGALHYIVQLDNDKLWKRHVDQIRRVGNIPIQEADDELDYGPPIIPLQPQRVVGAAQGDAQVQIVPRRCERIRRPPQRFGNPIAH